MKCEICGKEIMHPHYINGKVYGYNCYRMQLAIRFKQWEDEKNHEYAVKCFSAIEVFKGKKSNTFHDSICKQWDDCKKLTARQLQCIINGFGFDETIRFYCVWCGLTADESLKRSISSWIDSIIVKESKVRDYMYNEAVNDVLLYRYYKLGFHYWKDIDDDFVVINDNKDLQRHIDDEYIDVLKVYEVHTVPRRRRERR